MSMGSCPNGGDWYAGRSTSFPSRTKISPGIPAQIKTQLFSAVALLTHAMARDVHQAIFGPRDWAQEAVPSPPQMIVQTIKMNSAHMGNSGLVQTKRPPFKDAA
jgi:hypothetical protein